MNVCFYAHDHFYARQEKDSVIYQLVPQPAHEGTRLPGYGDLTGELRDGSGFINVTVSPSGYEMNFVQSDRRARTGCMDDDSLCRLTLGRADLF